MKTFFQLREELTLVIAKAMGHSSVTKSHHAIADYHNHTI